MPNTSSLPKLLAVGCLSGVFAMSHRAVAEAPLYGSFLEPEPGPYTLARERPGPELYDAFFFGMPRARQIQVATDGTAPEAVFSDNTGSDLCERTMTFIHIKLRRQSVPQREGVPSLAPSYDRDITKAELDCTTAVLLGNVWETMLTELRYYPNVRGVGDAAAYHFSYAAPGMLVKSGFTQFPEPNSRADQFVRVAHQLMEYVDSPAKEREGAKNEMVRQTTRLLQSARDRNARSVGATRAPAK